MAAARSDTDLDPVLSTRLISESREDDQLMLGGIWSVVGSGSILEIESSILHVDGAHVGVAEDLRADDARGIARTRNNLAQMADQLEAREAKIAELRALIPTCLRCNERPAACFGLYAEGMGDGPDPACDQCCAHSLRGRLVPSDRGPSRLGRDR